MTVWSGDATADASGNGMRQSGSIPEQIAAYALQAPTGIAVSVDGRDLSYAQLDAASRQACAQVRALGLTQGALIAVCLPRSAELISTIFGIWRAGAAYLALDPAWPDNRLRAIMADASIDALFCDADSSSRGIAPDGCPILWPDHGLAAAPVADADDSPESLAYVIYTSGSTGRPKGIEISHGNLASLTAWHLEAFDLGPSDRVAHIAGLGFDATIWEIWPALSAGATLLPAPEAARTSPEALRDWLVTARVTVAFVPTVLAEHMVALDWPVATALRFMLTGGDRLHVFPPSGLPFVLVNNYGPSECTVVATSGVVPPGDGTTALPTIGWPIAGTQIHLLDPAKRPVADGEAGEIYVAGSGVGRGYRGRPDLSAERFLPDRFDPAPGAMMFRTGDVGIRQTDGAIAFVDRIDDQVQIRGVRVEPAEIAATLARHPAIASATVLAVEDEDGGSLAAYLVLRDAPAPSAADMRIFLTGYLPEAMIPSTFVVIDALPLTANGKLDRDALPRPEQGKRLAEAAFGLPTTPVEKRLIAILSEVIKGRAIGIDDNFFMIGGHSLLGAQLVLRAGEAFGTELTLRDLFGSPTVRQLAVRVEAKIIEMVSAMSDEEAHLRVAE